MDAEQTIDGVERLVIVTQRVAQTVGALGGGSDVTDARSVQRLKQQKVINH